MNNVDKIQAVLNTLKLLEMPMSYDNANNMLGIYQTLLEVRDDLGKEGGSPDAGNDSAE